jgi:hypothetical protein
MIRLVLDLAMIALIGLIDFLFILYPLKTYDWFVVKLGRDQFRWHAPDRHPVFLWIHRLSGVIMFLGAIFFFVMRILLNSQ